ncbi:hypothetical protein MASR1M50_27860 [Burkholderiales bacterium]
MSSATHGQTPYYYVPAESRHPVMAAFGLLLMIIGASQWMNDAAWGGWLLLAGLVWWLFVLFQWFSEAVGESEARAVRPQDRPVLPLEHELVHLFGGDVLRCLLHRPVVGARPLGAGAGQPG